MVSLGIIEKLRRTFKMKAAFVEQKLPAVSVTETVHLGLVVQSPIKLTLD